MRRLTIIFLLALGLVLAACAPGVGTTLKRNGQVVTIQTQTGAEGIFGLRYTVLDATTADPRCLQVGEDLTCDIGDVPADTTVILQVMGPVGEVGCIMRFFGDEAQSAGSLRILPCQTSGA